MADLLSTKFRKSIEDSDFTDQKLSDLYDAVEGMSDEDFKEYMYVNREYFSQNMPAAVESIPGFQSYLSKEPNWGVGDKLDYKKITGSDDPLSDENFYKWTMKDFEEFAKGSGMTGRELMQQMAKDKIASDRYKIAHGEDKGGWSEAPLDNFAGAFWNLFGPRMQEAIARGESPSKKDVALDLGEDVVYATPWGKVGQAAKTVVKGAQKVSKATKAAKTTSKAKKASKTRTILEQEKPTIDPSNMVAPAITQAADAIAYGEDDQRGEASLTERGINVAKGTAVNEYMPKLTRRFPGARWVLQHIPEQAESFVTNRAGDAIYSNRQAPGVMGMPIRIAQQTLDLDPEKEHKEKQRKKNKKKAVEKYKIIIDMDEENKE